MQGMVLVVLLAVAPNGILNRLIDWAARAGSWRGA